MADFKGIFSAMLRGTYDSIKGMGAVIYLDKDMNDRLRTRMSPSRANTPVRRRESEINKETAPARSLKKFEESQVLKRTIQCSILNGGIFLLSILLFDYIFLPFLYGLVGTYSFDSSYAWYLTKVSVVFFFQTIWVLPLFVLSKIINCLWFQDIADSAYRYSRGRVRLEQSLSVMIADSLISVVVQALFLVQAMLIELVPMVIIAKLLSLVHMCMLYSLYVFEYKWFNMGWELHKRLTFIENNWPYFIGFGLPLAILTQLSQSWIINGCIFSILFPLFIISGNAANPVSRSNLYPLHLFSPVIAISNALLNKSIGQSRYGTKTVPELRR